MKNNNKTNYTNVTLNSTSSSIKAEPYPFSASAVIQSLFKFNKLDHDETCQGLLRRFVHKITNNNEISPHNDMVNKNCKGLINFKKVAFTLAEVLITLGIIGVVAAITIPGLINNYKANKLRTQFLKSYSTIQQAFKLMQEDDVSLDPTTYEGREYAKTFMKYLKGTTYCGVSTNTCFNGVDITYKYQNINNTTSIFHPLVDDGTILLADGTVLMMENGGKDYGEQVFVTVDINGYSEKPNRWGYDLFTFQLIDEELKPMGDKCTKYTDFDTYCNPSKGGAYNGIACASKAKNDTDYFKWVVKTLK